MNYLSNVNMGMGKPSIFAIGFAALLVKEPFVL